jgi:hypothetical protein
MHSIMCWIMPRSVVLHAADLHLDVPFHECGHAQQLVEF